MSPRSTTLPLYFWCRGSNSELLRWQRSINDAKWTFLPLFLASSITSFLFLTFVSCHAEIFSNFPFFHHCCLCIWNFHCLRHRNEFVNKTVMIQRIHPFFQWYDRGDVCVLLLLALVSCFRRHQQHKHICLAFRNAAVGFSTALYRYFARHCCRHRNFQLSTSGFDCDLEFLIVSLN